MSDTSRFGAGASKPGASGDNASIGEQAKDLGQSAAGEMRRFAEDRKAVGAEQVDRIAHAVHGAASEVESEMPQTADYIHRAAESLERASNALREQSVDDLLQTVGRFARSQPAAFFGGAILAGAALSRFLKSSTPSHIGTPPRRHG
jgi:hypothetical protein